MSEVKKRKLREADDLHYRFNVCLPNGTTVSIGIRNSVEESISFDKFVEKVKKRCCDSLKQSRRKIFWNSKDLCLKDCRGNKIESEICFADFKPNKIHILRLDDGAGQTADTFENMWDLTPDTDLLTELPDDYTFETALADLIDNSLQAVWLNRKGERKLISVEIDKAKVSVFDTGPGMDGSTENSIDKWGKMGASVNRSFKELAIGGKPPYLTPSFGMFGYGGTIASMHLGRNAVVSAKTKESKEVYWLRLERDALLKRSGSSSSWKAAGGIRDPSDSETELSPHGSFTKIVMIPKLELPDIYKLQCKLKDIYFPYIQCDEISKTGKTTTLVEFQINGMDLAEIEGGEVAVTNLHSCNGPDFVLDLHFSDEGKAASKSASVRNVREGNARLKCVYFPISEGKESIERILEKLKSDCFDIKEDYETFSRTSIRRLGRLLPEARWDLLPFMKPKQKRGARLQTLKRCCSRVKCFIDTDAGFNPIPSKTDLAPQHSFARVLKGLGGDIHEKEKGVKVQISKDGKKLTLPQLEREFQDWIFSMHSNYDDECNMGDDEPVLLIKPPNKDALGVKSDVVRVHQVITRKGKSWSRGERVKIHKGACAGFHKYSEYATLEFFLLEGFEREAGGEARIICRPIGVEEADGSVLTADTSTSLELHSSKSVPMIVIDSGKCSAVRDDEWSIQANKLNKKLPSKIEALGPKQCEALDIDGALPTDASITAGTSPPKELGAILRPGTFIPSSTSDDLDQNYIVKGDYKMCLDIKFMPEAGKCTKMGKIFSGAVTNTSRRGYSGLYIFSVGSTPGLFQKAGTYSFSFYLKDPATITFEKTVRVKASSKIKRWGLLKDDQNPLSVSVGSCFPSFSVARYDEYDNIIPFKSSPEITFQLMSNGNVLSRIKNTVELSSNHHHMMVKNVHITTDKLDHIKPSYEATFALSHLDKRPFLSIPCQVFPGPIKVIHCHLPESVKELLPKQVLEDIRLEVLDRYHNHVKQGTEVELEVHGFSFLDQIGPKHKVDDDGYIDLSGILKVTEGYGKPVSLLVKYNSNIIFTKKFQVEKRELRVKEVPETCRAGSKLDNIVFEVVNTEGKIDHTIHDEKQGKPHALKIVTDLPGSESLRCAFQQGCCTVPSITLPPREGTFFIEAFHTQHSELRVNFEINLSKSAEADDTMSGTMSDIQASEDQDGYDTQSLDDMLSPRSVSDATEQVMSTEVLELQDKEDESTILSPAQTPNMEHGISTPPILNEKFLVTSGKLSTLAESQLQEQQDNLAQTPNKLFDPNFKQDSDSYKTPEGKITLLGSNLLDFQDDLAQTPNKLSDPNFKQDSDSYKTPEWKITLLESNLPDLKDIKLYGTKIKEQEDDLKWLKLRKAELEENLTQSQAKLEVLSQSDCKSNKEAVLENIKNKVESPAAVYIISSQDGFLYYQHPEFSADVIGLVALLATAPTADISRSLAEYLGEDQMLGLVCQSSAAIKTPRTYEDVLISLADIKGRTIRGRQVIICLEDLRPYAGEFVEGSQRKLALPEPTLSDRSTPPGFLGYAVNMINIDPKYIHVKTAAGHGLRETLLYELFGELQVYETKEHLNHARGCITNGAVSLDGGIIHGKGIIFLGSKPVDVPFPVEDPKFLKKEQIMMEIERNKSELITLEEAFVRVNEELESSKKAFRVRHDVYNKVLEDLDHCIMSQ